MLLVLVVIVRIVEQARGTPWKPSGASRGMLPGPLPCWLQLEDYVAAAAGARVDRGRGATWQPEAGDLVLVRRLGNKPVQVAEAPDSKPTGDMPPAFLYLPLVFSPLCTSAR